MSNTRIPSPARSVGSIQTPRHYKKRGTRSVTSGSSYTPTRLTSIINMDKNSSFALSPLPNRISVLTDSTNIEEPRCKNWWEKAGDNSTQDVLDVLQSHKVVEANNDIEELIEMEILSQEKNKNNVSDLPESSDNESINSVVLPQRQLFAPKQVQTQNNFQQIIGNRETLPKLNKSKFSEDVTVKAGAKNLFQSNKRRKPIFPAELLTLSPDKTIVDNIKSVNIKATNNQGRNIFSNRPPPKRKNMFAQFIISENSEDDIPEIQPRGIIQMGFQKNSSNTTFAQNIKDSSSISSAMVDVEMDDWTHLPSSTMVDHHIKEINIDTPSPLKRPRLSKLSEVPESESGTTKQSNKSVVSKEVSNMSPKETSFQNQLIKNSSKIVNTSTTSVSLKVDPLNKSLNRTKQKPDPYESQSHSRNISPKSSKNNSFVKDSQNGPEVIVQSVDRTDNIELKNKEDDDNVKLVYEDNLVEQDKENYTNKVSKVRKSLSPQSKDKTIQQEQHDINVEITDKTNIELLEIQHSNEKNDSNNGLKEKIDKNEISQIHNEKENDQTENMNELEHIGKTQIDVGDDNNQYKQVKRFRENEKQNTSIKNNTLQNINENYEIKKQTRTNINNDCIADNLNAEIEEIERRSDNNTNYATDHTKAVETHNTDNEKQNNVSNTDLEKVNSQMDDKILTENNANLDYNNGNVRSDIKERGEGENKAFDDGNDDNNMVDGTENEDGNQNDDLNEIENNESDNENQVHVEAENDVTERREDDKLSEAEYEESHNENQDNVEPRNDSIDVEIDHEPSEVNNDESDIENQDDMAEIDVIDSQIDEDPSEVENNESDDEKQEENDASDKDQDDNNCEEAENENSDDENENDNGNYVESNANVSYMEDTPGDSDNQEDTENESQEDSDEEILLPNGIEEIGDVIERTPTPDEKSPEAVLRGRTMAMNSFTEQGKSSNVRDTLMMRSLHIRPSLVHDSVELSDGTKNSSTEGSAWDSHRTTRKTLRQTLGRDFTMRKSLRALVMEKSAKSKTTVDGMHSETAKFPQANSTEYPEVTNRFVDDTLEESNHEMSIRTRQTKLEQYMQAIKKQNLELRLKMEEKVKNLLNTTPNNPIKVPIKATFRGNPIAKSNSKTKKTKPKYPIEYLSAELLEDLKYKPPKRYKPPNASWSTKTLYNFIEKKLEPRYDYRARVRAEKFVETLFDFTKDIKKFEIAPNDVVEALKYEMARLDIVKTHYQFYNFFNEFMPREIKIKVVPDIVNRIPMPKDGIFSNISLETD